MKAGHLIDLSFHPARCNDSSLAAQSKDLPAGCLYLADMGFFGAARLARLSTRCFWITRIPAHTKIRRKDGKMQGLGDWFHSIAGDEDDGPGERTEAVGTPCRLVALRCPELVATARRRRLRSERRSKDGREPSAAQLAACDWSSDATNVPMSMLNGRAVWTAYRCRWQMELLFKRAKSLAGWSFTHGQSANRVLTELLVKVLGLIVMHWLTLMRGPALAGWNTTRLMRRISECAWELSEALWAGGKRVIAVLERLARELLRVDRRRARVNMPSTADLLNDPELACNTD